MLAAIIDMFPLRVFRFKTKPDANALFGTFTHLKNHYDINVRVTSTTYYSQLSKRSHLQLVPWVAKTCANMSRLVANTSHSVNNHYNSNSDTIWTNLVSRVYCPAIVHQKIVPELADTFPLSVNIGWNNSLISCHSDIKKVEGVVFWSNFTLKRFISSPVRPDRLRVLPSLVLDGHRGLFLWG